MTDAERELLSEGVRALGFHEHENLLSQLERYYAELTLWNRKLRLVDARGHELIVRHLLDCLAAVPAIRFHLRGHGQEIADLGSGAGLPGIVLAIVLPEHTVTLVERSGRRCGFLRNCQAVLGLRNANVLEGAYETLGENRFDLVTSRAFAAIDKAFVEQAVYTLRPGGYGVFLKGRRERIASELDSLGQADGDAESPRAMFEVMPLSVPFLDEERHAVVMQAPLES